MLLTLLAEMLSSWRRGVRDTTRRKTACHLATMRGGPVHRQRGCYAPRTPHRWPLQVQTPTRRSSLFTYKPPECFISFSWINCTPDNLTNNPDTNISTSQIYIDNQGRTSIVKSLLGSVKAWMVYESTHDLITTWCNSPVARQFRYVPTNHISKWTSIARNESEYQIWYTKEYTAESLQIYEVLQPNCASTLHG